MGEPKKRPITTGGAGYIPYNPIENIQLDPKKVYNRVPGDAWYNFVNESRDYNEGTGGAVGGVYSYLLNKDNYVENRLKRYTPYKNISWNEAMEAERKFREESRKIKYKYNKLSSSKRRQLEKLNDKADALTILQHEDAKDVYLGMPQRTGTLKPAEYSPTQGTLNNGMYITYMRDPGFIEDVILPTYNRYKTGNIKKGGKKILGDIISLPDGNTNVHTITSKGNAVVNVPFLSNATMSKGYDSKGEYISVFDTWDYNTDLFGTPGDDVGKNIKGKPFDIYDRYYLDDVYGVNQPTHSTYLPELVVTGNKKAEGGTLNSWNNLSIKEKADVMKVAIQNGITTLPEIKQAYNEFAEGGPEDKEKSILEKVKEKEAAFNEKLVKPIKIGYDKNRAFTLTNAGSLTGAHLSEEMTDYIIQEAEKAGVDLQTAFGIAAAESTLGNPTDDKSAWNISSGIRRAFNNKYPGTAQHINTYGDAVNEQELFNFYYPLENQNPYTQQIAEAERQARKGKDFEQVLKEGMAYADKLAQRSVPTSSVAQQAFEYFKQNGEGYAPGYKKQTGQSYVQHVKKKGKEVLQSPEIQRAITNYALKSIGRPREYSIGTFNWEPFDWRKKAEGGNLFDGTSQPTQQMQQGHVYEVLPQMLRNAGLNVKVTSGYRKAGAAGKAGSKSWHTRHGAVDIVPQGKTTFSDIEDALYNNPEISSYMLANGFGLIDESGRTEESKATMRKTGATGAHFHIGKDSAYAKRYADRMAKNVPLIIPESPSIQTYNAPAFMPSNPQAFFNPFTYQAPQIEPEIEQPLVEAALNNAYTPEQLEKEQRMNNLNTLSMILGMTSPQGSDNSFVNTLGMLAGNMSAYGGHIYDGTSEQSQKMNRPNIFRYDDGRYVYQAAPNAEEIDVTPINTLIPDASQWTYQDAEGKIYTPNTQVSTGTLTEAEDTNPLMRAANNYVRELEWRAKNDPSSIALQGKYTMPAILSPLLAPIGEAAYAAGYTPYINAGLTSAFAAHGLNHWMNEGIDSGWDAAMTAMEIAPLGGLAKPMWNAGKEALNSYKYTHSFGKPVIPSNYYNLKPAEIIQGEENWASSLPGVKDYSITRVEPYSGYTPINQTQEYKNFVDDVMQGNSWGRNRGAVYSTKNRDFGAGITDSEQLGAGAEATVLKNPDDPSRVLKFSRDSSLASDTREAAVENAEQYASKRNMAPYNMPLSVEGAYESNGSFYPVFSQERITPVSAENILAVDNKIGELNNSVGGGMYYPGTSRVNNILSENDIARTVDFKPENVGITSEGSIMGIDLGVDYSGRVPKGFVSPQITAENAAENGMGSSIGSINVEHSLDNISRFKGSSPIPTGHQGMVGYRPKQRTAVWDSAKQDMVPLKSIDEVPNLRKTIDSILRRIKTEDIRPEFLNENAYVNAFRDNATRQGININDLSHEDIAKILTEQYNQLREGSSGILRDNILWRTWGRTIPPNEFNWQEHLGEFTQNKGFWGEGNYFGTGVYGSSIANQPYMINDITAVGYDDLLGATTKAGDAIREGKNVGSQLATGWMSESPSTRIVAATENGARNRYGWLDTGDQGIEIVTQKNTGIKALNPDLTIGNGETFPRDWSNPDAFKGLLPLLGLGASGTLYGKQE